MFLYGFAPLPAQNDIIIPHTPNREPTTFDIVPRIALLFDRNQTNTFEVETDLTFSPDAPQPPGVHKLYAISFNRFLWHVRLFWLILRSILTSIWMS